MTVITVGDFNTLYTSVGHRDRKLTRKTVALNNTLDQMNITDTYRTFHPETEYTFMSNAHGTFSRIYHMLGHKINLI